MGIVQCCDIVPSLVSSFGESLDIGLYFAPQLPRGFDHFYGTGRGGEPPLPRSAGRGGEPPLPAGRGVHPWIFSHQGKVKTALAAGAVGVGAGALTSGLVLNSYQEYRSCLHPRRPFDHPHLRELQQERGGRTIQLDCAGGCTGGAQCVAGLCACPEGG